MALTEKLSRTHPQFQADITAAAKACGKTPAQVYSLWVEYTKTCASHDQSPVWPEFRQWYAADLAPVASALTADLDRILGW